MSAGIIAVIVIACVLGAGAFYNGYKFYKDLRDYHFLGGKGKKKLKKSY